MFVFLGVLLCINCIRDWSYKQAPCNDLTDTTSRTHTETDCKMPNKTQNTRLHLLPRTRAERAVGRHHQLLGGEHLRLFVIAILGDIYICVCKV